MKKRIDPDMPVGKLRSKKHQDWLVRLLKNPREASAYLNAALEEKDSKVFLLALRNVAEAFGGLKEISRRTRLNRESLYRMLSDRGNPEISSLERVLESVGLRLAVEVSRKPPRKTPVAA